MKRGDLYLLRRPGGGDPKKQRVMIVVSRQALVDYGLVSIPKSRLTDFVGSLSPEKLSRLSQALRITLDI